jgi:hypothetical protein
MTAASAGNPRRIDVHHHHTSPSFCALIRALNTGQKHHEDWQPADSIATMDEGGVATSVTSTTEPGVWAGDDQAACDLARESNDYQADLVVNYPGRFGMFTTLPMPNIEGTLREIEYGFDVLKADGVCFMTSYLGKYLGDPTFTPVMEELDRRHAVAYVHPTRTKITNLVPDLIDAILEYGTETSRTIASLMFGGTALSQHPLHLFARRRNAAVPDGTHSVLGRTPPGFEAAAAGRPGRASAEILFRHGAGLQPLCAGVRDEADAGEPDRVWHRLSGDHAGGHRPGPDRFRILRGRASFDRSRQCAAPDAAIELVTPTRAANIFALSASAPTPRLQITKSGSLNSSNSGKRPKIRPWRNRTVQSFASSPRAGRGC